MTSKNSSFNLAYENAKQRLWNIALSVLLLLFTLPIFSAIQLGRWSERLANNRTTFADIMESFQYSVTGPKNLLVNCVTGALAVLIAFGGFGYLFSKSKVDLYHSLPIKRSKLFFVSYVNGIIFYAVPYFLFLLITLGIGSSYHFVSTATVATALTTYIANVLGFILLYTTTILAIMMTGNVFVAILADCVFFFYGPTIRGLLLAYAATFYKTFYSMRINDNWYSPLSEYADLMMSICYATNPEKGGAMPLLFLTMVICIVILLALCIYLYRKRPSEAAAKAMSFEKTKPVIKILLMTPIALYAGFIFRDIRNSSGTSNDLWLVFGLIIGLLLSHAIIEIIYSFDFKAAFHNMHHILIAGAFVVLFTVIFRFDLFHYDSYLPAVESLDYIAISSYDVQGEINYVNMEDEMAYYSPYVDSENYVLDHMKLTDTQGALTLAQIGIESLKNYPRNNDEEANDYYSSGMIQMVYLYKLKNGKHIYRSYDVKIDECMDAFNEVYMQKEYKNAVYPIMTVDSSYLSDYELYTPFATTKLNTVLSDEEIAELISIYQEELAAQSVQDLKDNYPVGQLFIPKSITQRPSRYYNAETIEGYQGFIFENFDRSIAFLKEHGLDLVGFRDPSKVERIVVSFMGTAAATDAVDTKETQNSSAEITDKEDLSKILNSSILSTFSNANNFLHRTDYNDVMDYYDIAVYYNMSDKQKGVTNLTVMDDEVLKQIQKYLKTE